MKDANTVDNFVDDIISTTLAKKYAKIESKYSNPLEAEDILPVIEESKYITLKTQGNIFINLPSYVTIIEDKAWFEDNLFLDHVSIVVRLLDDYVDIRLHEIQLELKKLQCFKRKKSIDRYKKLQLEASSLMLYRGIEFKTVGLEQMALDLGIEKDSGEFYLFQNKLNQLIVTTVYSVSIELAEERGSFPNWNFKMIDDQIFSLEKNDLMTYELIGRVTQYGLRNNILITSL